MKKFFRFVGILLLVIVLIIIVLGLVGPKEVTVERSVMINAPREVVWAEMVNFKNGPHWDPWYATDSTAKREYFGTDGQPGSGYSWEGEKLGAGNMKDTGHEGNKMNYSLHFEKPFKADASGFYEVADAGNGQTKVTWNYYGKLGFMMRAMQPIMSMDKMMGPQFETGLNKLKAYVESGKAGSASGAAVQETEYPGHIYAGVRKTIGWNDMGKVMNETFTNLGKEMGAQITGPAADLVYMWDTAKHQADVAMVFPVKDTAKAIKGATFFNVPASKAVMTVLKGGYGGMYAAHGAVNKYIAEKGLHENMVVEEYIVGPGENKDSAQWVTNIYYLLK